MKVKRLFAVLLALVMAFSFAACSGDKKVYTELKEGDTGSGPFDASTLCASFSIPEGFDYELSRYDVNLELEEYDFSLKLKKDESNIYFLEAGYAYNDTAEDEYEAFITAKTFDDTTITRNDDVTIGGKTFKVVTITDSLSTQVFYIYTYDSTAANHKMNLIISPVLSTTPMDAPEIVAFMESIVAK